MGGHFFFAAERVEGAVRAGTVAIWEWEKGVASRERAVEVGLALARGEAIVAEGMMAER